MDQDRITEIAFRINAAFEDHYFDPKKRGLFESIFNRYLAPIDPEGGMEPYDAIELLGRSHPEEFERMLKELRDLSLIAD